jgi:hypothetical protein
VPKCQRKHILDVPLSGGFFLMLYLVNLMAFCHVPNQGVAVCSVSKAAGIVCHSLVFSDEHTNIGFDFLGILSD